MTMNQPGLPVRLRVGLLVVGFVVATALLSLVWTPFDVAAIDIDRKLMAPSGAHLLGTDHFGRDVLSMICLLYTSPSPRDKRQSRMPSSA